MYAEFNSQVLLIGQFRNEAIHGLQQAFANASADTDNLSRFDDSGSRARGKFNHVTVSDSRNATIIHIHCFIDDHVKPSASYFSSQKCRF